MKTTRLLLGKDAALARLEKDLGGRAPPVVEVLGDQCLLRRRALAFFSSQRCPGRLVSRAYDLAQKLRDAGVTVIGGFHSPMERECLRILLQSPHPVLWCPARGLPRRLAPEPRKAVAQGRLLVLSPFGGRVHRATEETAAARNRFVAALADRVFVAHAAPGSKTEVLAGTLAGSGKPVHTFADPANRKLIALGARPVELDSLEWIRGGPGEDS